ncbi:MAG: hypothetical protein DWI22_03725 [Planctomycetota bacterium]|nr:MAG: hypothetical protein DWI22_03725 [Planctomycetota bacterium]
MTRNSKSSCGSSKTTGGWRYAPSEAGDTSVVGWPMMTLKSGEMAGTWNPADNWEQQGGSLYATSMKLRLLEISYRHPAKI